MSIAVLVMTDGRDKLLDRTLPEWLQVPSGSRLITETWIHDDTGWDDHRQHLKTRHPDCRVIGSGPRRGFGGAIAYAWSQLRVASAARYVLHIEDDFFLARSLDLAAMVEVMDNNPHIAQMALRRQPWNDAERRAGGIVEQHPDDYTEVTDSRHTWLEHRRFFTTNPSIYRLSLCEREWPVGLESEGRFGIALFASDPSLRVAFWGARDSGVWVEHIGHVRAGSGY